MARLEASLGLLNASDGSAQMTHGETVVLVGVYGPRGTHGRILRSCNDRMGLVVTFKPVQGKPGTLEAERSSIVRNTLEVRISPSARHSAALMPS